MTAVIPGGGVNPGVVRAGACAAWPLPPDERGAGFARAVVKAVCADLRMTATATYDASVALSELATNVYLHAYGGRGAAAPPPVPEATGPAAAALPRARRHGSVRRCDPPLAGRAAAEAGARIPHALPAGRRPGRAHGAHRRPGEPSRGRAGRRFVADRAARRRSLGGRARRTRLAGDAAAEARRDHRRGGLSRRPRHAGHGAAASGLVPEPGVAVPAGLPVAADLPGGGVRRTLRRGRGRSRVGGRRRAPRARPDAAVPAPGATVRTVRKVAGQRVRAASSGPDADAVPARRADGDGVRGARAAPVRRVRGRRRPAQRDRAPPRRSPRRAGPTTIARSVCCSPDASRTR